MKKYFRLTALILLLVISSGCGAELPQTPTSTTIQTTAQNTEGTTEITSETLQTTPAEETVQPKYYYDFKDENTVYSCTDFNNVTVKPTEDGMQVQFNLTDGNDTCFDPYFSLPSPTAQKRFRVNQYPYAVIIANTSRCDLPAILRYHVKNIPSPSYPSIYFYFEGTGRQKVILNLADSEQVMFVDAQYHPIKGTLTDIRLDVFENEANVNDFFVLESVAFFKTLEEAESFTGIIQSENTDISVTPGYDISDKWLAEEFTNPSNVYRARKLLYQFDRSYEFTLSALQHMGYGGVLTNVPFTDQYLKNDEDFALLKEAFDKANEMGFELWLYDEYQWPSGKAFGYVLDYDANFEATGVELLTITGEGNISYTLPDEYISLIGASLETEHGFYNVETSADSVNLENSGKYTLYVYARRHTYPIGQTEDRTNFFSLRNVDLLNPDAVAKFIEITYDKYRDELTDTFEDVTAFFTDEPNLGNRDYANYVVWTDALPQKFLEMHGYDITEHMHSLYFGNSEEDKIVRINFYDTVSQMFAEAYTEQIAAWCAENGVESSGHLLFEEPLYRHIETYGGDFMDIVGKMSIPGIDILHVEGENLLNSNSDVGSYIGIKYVASVAKNTGKTDVMIEYTPLANTSARFLDDPDRYSIEGATISTFCGANNFCVICPDSGFTVNAAKNFNSYIGRINALLDNSTTVTPIGLFVPTDSARAEHIAGENCEGEIDSNLKICAETLLKNGLDFTFIDAESIEQGAVTNGKFNIGLGEYSVIIMPQTDVMSLQTANKLKEFEENGGTIIWTGARPSISTKLNESAALTSIVENLGEDFASYGLEKIRDNFAPSIQIEGGNELLWVSQYTRLDSTKEIFYLANFSTSTISVDVSFPDSANFDVYVPLDGNVISANESAKIEIQGFNGVLIVRER